MTLKTAKIRTLRVARATGLFDAAERIRRLRNRNLLILCYHGIALDDEAKWSPSLYMDVASFRRRLEMLRDGGYRVLPLGEAVERFERNDLPPKSVVLTFDDGAYDFYALAYPLLREFGFPVTLYLTTYYCTFQTPVFDTVCWYLIWKSIGKKVDLTGLLPDAGETLIPPGVAAYEIYRQRVYPYVRAAGLSAADKDAWAAAFAERAGIDYNSIRSRRLLHLMTPAEVREVAGHGVDIQLHTHRHRTPRDRELFLREIDDNAKAIAAMTGLTRPLVHFCYPCGDYDRAFLPWLRERGVRSATTCLPGFVSPSAEPLLLPRVLDNPALSEIEFEGWLSGFSAYLPQR